MRPGRSPPRAHPRPCAGRARRRSGGRSSGRRPCMRMTCTAPGGLRVDQTHERGDVARLGPPATLSAIVWTDAGQAGSGASRPRAARPTRPSRAPRLGRAPVGEHPVDHRTLQLRAGRPSGRSGSAMAALESGGDSTRPMIGWAASPDRFVIVIPTYNERENLARVVVVLDEDARAGASRRRPGGGRREPRRHGGAGGRAGPRVDRVHVLHRAGKAGLGKAYLAAFDWALQRDHRFVLEMDADWSDPRPPDAHRPRLDRRGSGPGQPLGRRRRQSELGLGRRLISGAARSTPALLGFPSATSPEGSSASGPRSSGPSTSTRSRPATASRSSSPTGRSTRASGWWRFPSCSRTAGGTAKMSRAIVAEAVWKVPALRLRAVRGRLDGPPAVGRRGIPGRVTPTAIVNLPVRGQENRS